MKKRLSMLAIWALIVAITPLALFWMLLCVVGGADDKYWRFARAFDRVGNVATGGKESETISGRAGRLMGERRWACVLCRLLDHIEKNHCKDSIGV